MLKTGCSEARRADGEAILSREGGGGGATHRWLGRVGIWGWSPDCQKRVGSRNRTRQIRAPTPVLGHKGRYPPESLWHPPQYNRSQRGGATTHSVQAVQQRAVRRPRRLGFRSASGPLGSIRNCPDYPPCGACTVYHPRQCCASPVLGLGGRGALLVYLWKETHGNA